MKKIILSTILAIVLLGCSKDSPTCPVGEDEGTDNQKQFYISSIINETNYDSYKTEFSYNSNMKLKSIKYSVIFKC